MDWLIILLGAGILIGSGIFLVAAWNARRYANGKTPAASGEGRQGLRGMAWIALAACGALYVFTSIAVLTRLNEKEAELTRRKTMVATLDRKVYVCRDGIKKLQGTVTQAKVDPASEQLLEHIETILAEVRDRERKLP